MAKCFGDHSIGNLWLSLNVLLLMASAQNLPSNPCPNYFQYLSDGYSYVGRIVLPIGLGHTMVHVQLSQRSAGTLSNYGSIDLEEDKETTLQNIQSGKQIGYIVEFAIPSAPAKLVKIIVNGRTICQGKPYPPPQTNIQLAHTLSAKTWITRGSPPPVQTPQPVKKPPPVQTPPPVQAPQPPPPVQAPQPPQPPVISFNDNCIQQSRVFQSVGLVAGGSPIQRGDFPWLVAMYHTSPSKYEFLCGASLISATIVLSAVHCFERTGTNEANAVFYIGRYNLSRGNENFQTRVASRIIYHPNYNRANVPDADIAVVRLDMPVRMTEYIKPVCLWSPWVDRMKDTIVGMDGVIVGWGDDNDLVKVSTVPNMISQKIVSNSVCRNSDVTFLKLVTEYTFCAGNQDGTGPCFGDSGGGMFVDVGGTLVLRGIISTALRDRERCHLYKFVVYTDVAKHHDWIVRTIQVIG